MKNCGKFLKRVFYYCLLNMAIICAEAELVLDILVARPVCVSAATGFRFLVQGQRKHIASEALGIGPLTLGLEDNCPSTH